MNVKETRKDTVERDENGRTWGERNGATIFGVSVFFALFLIGMLMWIAG